MKPSFVAFFCVVGNSFFICSWNFFACDGKRLCSVWHHWLLGREYQLFLNAEAKKFIPCFQARDKGRGGIEIEDLGKLELGYTLYFSFIIGNVLYGCSLLLWENILSGDIQECFWSHSLNLFLRTRRFSYEERKTENQKLRSSRIFAFSIY